MFCCYSAMPMAVVVLFWVICFTFNHLLQSVHIFNWDPTMNAFLTPKDPPHPILLPHFCGFLQIFFGLGWVGWGCWESSLISATCMQFEPSLFCSSFGLMFLVYFPFSQVASPLACLIETLLAKWYSSINAFYHMPLSGDTFDGFFPMDWLTF